MARVRLRRAGSDDDAADAVRVLVLGDASVGKTSLVEMICRGGAGVRPDGEASAPKRGDWTRGCALSLCRECVEVDQRTAEVEVEFWEVGGTKTYAYARPVFYDGLDAILLVYDVSNVKSYHSLVVWLFELCTSVWPPSLRYWDAGGGSGGVPDIDLEGGGSRPLLQQAILEGRIPVLFVANKCDLQSAAAPSATLRPSPPGQQPRLERLFGGEPGPGICRSAADARLMEQLCDFVQQGRHTSACSREDERRFDFPLWRDFVRGGYEGARGVELGEASKPPLQRWGERAP